MLQRAQRRPVLAGGAAGVAVPGQRVAQPIRRDFGLALEARAQALDIGVHRVVEAGSGRVRTLGPQVGELSEIDVVRGGAGAEIVERG